MTLLSAQDVLPLEPQPDHSPTAQAKQNQTLNTKSSCESSYSNSDNTEIYRETPLATDNQKPKNLK
jgi:hypothetical protein